MQHVSSFRYITVCPVHLDAAHLVKGFVRSPFIAWNPLVLVDGCEGAHKVERGVPVSVKEVAKFPVEEHIGLEHPVSGRLHLLSKGPYRILVNDVIHGLVRDLFP